MSENLQTPEICDANCECHAQRHQYEKVEGLDWDDKGFGVFEGRGLKKIPKDAALLVLSEDMTTLNRLYGDLRFEQTCNQGVYMPLSISPPEEGDVVVLEPEEEWQKSFVPKESISTEISTGC